MKNLEDIHNQHKTWVYEAMDKHSYWREESWEDYAFRDGCHWSPEVKALLIQKGINPLTINRVLPLINLIFGYYVNNQKDIVVKGRSSDDVDMAKVLEQAISLVMDTYSGNWYQQQAVMDQIVAGIGFMGVDYNADPRAETVEPYYIPWSEVWWDPAVPPFFDNRKCKYVFTAAWKDLELIKSLYPEYARELDTLYTGVYQNPRIAYGDPALYIEEERLYYSSRWLNRDRVRLVDLYYPRYENGKFIVFPDGNVIDLFYNPDFQMPEGIDNYREVTAIVPRMWHKLFIDNVVFEHEPTQFNHDEYPFVPYIAYLDRYGRPFGIPRAIKEQNREVNSRRSMALALINGRRTFIEEGAAVDPIKAFDEVNRVNGFVQLRAGKLGAIKVVELADLAKPQVDLMIQSEKEMLDITGADQELAASTSNDASKLALEYRKQFSLIKLASVFENILHAQKLLGQLIISGVQATWVSERVIRVTDSLTAIDKYVTINKKTSLGFENDITQLSVDLIITSKSMTDTVREKNLELIFAAINASPKEMVPGLLSMAYELSDLPNKEALMTYVRQTLNVPEFDLKMSTTEKQQLMAQKYMVMQEKAAKDAKLNDTMAELTVKTKYLEAERLAAEIDSLKQSDQQSIYDRGTEEANQYLETLKQGQISQEME